MPATVPTTAEVDAVVAGLTKKLADLTARVAALEVLVIPRYGQTRYR